MRLNHFLFFMGVLLLNLSCSNEKKIQEKEPLQMREASELAVLMEQMYAFNDSIKQQIINGESLSKMPYDLEQLHTLEMTNRFERDANFQKFAAVFKKYQSDLYEMTQDSLKLTYNNAIQSCIACHQTSCTGPIPRIKKLLID